MLTNASASAKPTTPSATVTVSIVGPPNPGTGLGTPNLSAARFLEQAAFGPTSADIAHLQQVGYKFRRWLDVVFMQRML